MAAFKTPVVRGQSITELHLIPTTKGRVVLQLSKSNGVESFEIAVGSYTGTADGFTMFLTRPRQCFYEDENAAFDESYGHIVPGHSRKGVV